MKPGIHPSYYEDALIVCGTCGTTFRVGSTKKEIHVDVCSNCHPFYTGEQRIVDTAGQVERFMKRQAAKEVVTPKTEVKPKKERRQHATTSSLLTRTVEPRPKPPKRPKVASGAAEAANLVGEVAPVNQQAVIEGAEAPAAVSEPIERKARPPRKPRPVPAETANAVPEASAVPETSADN